MVPIVQLVRASDCGSECRGFESHWAPKKEVERLPFVVQWGENTQDHKVNILSRALRMDFSSAAGPAVRVSSLIMNAAGREVKL